MVNYFDLYALPFSFHPDYAKVREKYYELSRQFHPDRFAQLGPEAVEEALSMAALNNTAYKILKDRDATTAYILRFFEVLSEDEKYNLPSEFLMEMMDFNELVSDYEMGPDDKKRQLVVGNLEQYLDALEKGMAPFIKEFEQGDHGKDLLLKIKDYYFRKKYLLRIQERIAKFATP